MNDLQTKLKAQIEPRHNFVMMTGRTHTAEKNSSHKQQSADLLKTLLPVMNIDVARVDVYDDKASKGKVLQNISNEKVFQ